MSIPLNSILNLTEEEIKNSKILLNTKKGKEGPAFIDDWLKCSEQDRSAGKPEVCSYWGWSGNRRNFKPGQWAFNFFQLDTTTKWLFVSAAKVMDVPEAKEADVKILTKYRPFFGRLIINLERSARQTYCFNLKSYLESATVKEILPALYSGETFQGYDSVCLSHERLSRIFNGEILPTYLEALKKVKGVYCLTDRKNGKLYIGSASGAGGVAQRWDGYLHSKHGGNEELRKLYDGLNKRKPGSGDKYFKDNFTFTLLEHFSIYDDDRKVRDREKWWKECLDTRKHGYNDN